MMAYVHYDNIYRDPSYNKMFQTRAVQTIKTRILCSVLGDNVGKYCRAGQATDDNMAHAF